MLNKHLIAQIQRMVTVDQGARNVMTQHPTLPKEVVDYLVYAIDGTNNGYIHNIISAYGYPTTKLIGKQAMSSFWLLVQHQDFDLPLQQACLQNCDFAPKDQALLTDRVLVNQGKKQLFGTQFQRGKNKKLTVRPVDDMKLVEKRRKEVGLEPFKEYQSKMLARDKELKMLNKQTKKS